MDKKTTHKKKTAAKGRVITLFFLHDSLLQISFPEINVNECLKLKCFWRIVYSTKKTNNSNKEDELQ